MNYSIKIKQYERLVWLFRKPCLNGSQVIQVIPSCICRNLISVNLQSLSQILFISFSFRITLQSQVWKNSTILKYWFLFLPSRGIQWFLQRSYRKKIELTITAYYQMNACKEMYIKKLLQRDASLLHAYLFFLVWKIISGKCITNPDQRKNTIMVGNCFEHKKACLQ